MHSAFTSPVLVDWYVCSTGKNVLNPTKVLCMAISSLPMNKQIDSKCNQQHHTPYFFEGELMAKFNISNSAKYIYIFSVKVDKCTWARLSASRIGITFKKMCVCVLLQAMVTLYPLSTSTDHNNQSAAMWCICFIVNIFFGGPPTDGFNWIAWCECKVTNELFKWEFRQYLPIHLSQSQVKNIRILPPSSGGRKV